VNVGNHAAAHLGVGKRFARRAKILADVVDPRGGGDGASYRRMRDDELQQELRPVLGLDFIRPYGELLASKRRISAF
jgi:hypothetical protein